MAHPEIVRQGFKPNHRLHNFLVALYHVARVPLPLCAVAVAALVVLGSAPFERHVAAAAVLGGACAADLLLLLLLPRLRLSFGWPQPPWLLYALGRSALAACCALFPWPLALLAGVQGVLTVLSLYGSLVEPFWLQHTELTVPLQGLGGRVRVLLLTDLHMERTTRREQQLVQLVRARRPDLILLGGDLLNLSFVGDPVAIAHARELLRALRPAHGIYFVRGTRDVDPPAVADRILEGLPVRALEDELLQLELGPARLQLLGIPADGEHLELTQRLVDLCARADPQQPLLCLHHTPDLVEHAADLGVDLYLAGHTHGGQICLPLLGPVATSSRFGRRYARGFHRLGPGGRTRAHVSRGVGLEGLGAPRMRFLARPELVWIELVDPS